MHKIKEIYDIFSLFKNKNIQKNTIIEVLSEANKFVTNISDLKRHNQNLLSFSCLYDNENLFKFLTNNFKEDFKADYKNCVLLNYVNKNPNILKIALENIEEQTKEELEDLMLRFGTNCYRAENILIVAEWLDKKLDNDSKDKFIEILFNKNNKSFLYEIMQIDNWKKLVEKYSPKNNLEQSIYFYLQKVNIKKKEKEFEIEINQNTTEQKTVRKKRILTKAT